MIIKIIKVAVTIILVYINFSLIKNTNDLSLKYKGTQILDPSCIKQIIEDYNITNGTSRVYYEYRNINGKLVINPIEVTVSELKLLKLGEGLELENSRIDHLIDRDISKSFTLAIIIACLSIFVLAILWDLGELFFEFIVHIE